MFFQNNNSLFIVGAGFQDYIDHLSISFQATAEEVIIWDATTDIYETMETVVKFNTDVHNMSLLTMIMTLGKYMGPIKCETPDGRDSTKKFNESLVELHVVSRELTYDEEV
ncbi:unnamed protein product [Adineta ricciae]|uniref:Uncharacterized protein n=1 Tax=Adineta ricciae TaxID=249248 RepID=A0A814LD17_ADIRI|nr:unnamed protein product [Adineta ricciae]CAF1063033.1 unnamed protein product [Adineta ricciae]